MRYLALFSVFPSSCGTVAARSFIEPCDKGVHVTCSQPAYLDTCIDNVDVVSGTMEGYYTMVLKEKDRVVLVPKQFCAINSPLP